MSVFGDDPFARFGVERSGGVPYLLVLFGRPVSFALDGQHVEQFGTGYPLQIAQYADQLRGVVSVHRTEIPETEALEQVALLQEALLERIARLLDQASEPGKTFEPGPGLGLEQVVALGRRYAQEVFFQRPDVRVDGHAVVVEDDQQVGVGRSGVVESLEGETSGQRPVADNGDHLPFLPRRAEAVAIPSAAEIDVEECPVPKAS